MGVGGIFSTARVSAIPFIPPRDLFNDIHASCDFELLMIRAPVLKTRALLAAVVYGCSLLCRWVDYLVQNYRFVWKQQVKCDIRVSKAVEFVLSVLA